MVADSMEARNALVRFLQQGMEFAALLFQQFRRGFLIRPRCIAKMRHEVKLLCVGKNLCRHRRMQVAFIRLDATCIRVLIAVLLCARVVVVTHGQEYNAVLVPGLLNQVSHPQGFFLDIFRDICMLDGFFLYAGHFAHHTDGCDLFKLTRVISCIYHTHVTSPP